MLQSRRPIADNVNPYQKLAGARHQKAAYLEHVKKVHKRRIALLLGLLVVILAVCGFQIYRSNQTLAQTNQQVALQSVKLKQVKTNKADLKLQVKQLQNNDYLQKVIRQKYYYSKGNETIYSLPTDKAATIPGE
ncbi:FtsB family cell division protein [Loigolactobacillus backii]|uniref:Uncharacterized protein n=1 Tax=Loigolactobacillus backii TaxID=375175 RepID=A0A192GXT6_9LACO|nr:septum formation initiator family protein [Loigolactobacillus backii]ANK59002.1 hypothetical protein AYR52_01185 [Loigolactobacillus backii]ANK61329.1 hypothetical protein AYR53_00305 [Loigolactobacillus backii]ANK63990.1 hypothetical protein AYR54_01170 [Loigolactobacillus backii]ANK66439.1 hypothetical protein AYR55_01180 [Loigolactobacillus backii]ANK69471.1 hypothetical protein AYR56_04410 [Loigolactobacillus backii]